MTVICFLKKFVDLKNDKVKYKIIPETSEEYFSVIYDCIRFNDSSRLLSDSFDK